MDQVVDQHNQEAVNARVNPAVVNLPAAQQGGGGGRGRGDVEPNEQIRRVEVEEAADPAPVAIHAPTVCKLSDARIYQAEGKDRG